MSRVRSRPERPVVVIVHVGEPAALRDVRAGLEEEGVPARAERVEAGGAELGAAGTGEFAAAGFGTGEFGTAGTVRSGVGTAEVGRTGTGTAGTGTSEVGTAEVGRTEAGTTGTGRTGAGTARTGTADPGPGESGTSGTGEAGSDLGSGTGAGAAVALAHEAARRSPLDVGVGLAADGSVCVHHAKLDPATPALAGDRSAARSCGHNAARLVVGIPLKDLPGG